MELRLKYAHLSPQTWEKLSKIERTGWVMWKVNNPETVQEHILSLLHLVEELKEKLIDFTPIEIDELKDMLEIHDWIEAIVGDEVIFTDDINERKKLKALLHEKELVAMQDITKDMGEQGKRILDLWIRFEQSDDKIANFARQLDKYQAIEKAAEYQKAQGIKLFDEFYDYSKNSITHPVLVEGMERLKLEIEYK